MNEISIQPSNTVPQNVYKPSEIIGMFNSILSRQSVNAQIIYLRGVYLMNQKASNWSFCYDTLRDEDSQEELTLRLTIQQRENLKNGNLVSVGGVLNRKVDSKGHIQLVLHVTRIEIVQEQAIDEIEIKRIEIRQKKSAKGFKNVDSILEQLLFIDARPKVALVLAETSITMSDFEAGINSAKSAIDFEEFRVNFSNTNEVIALLKDLDNDEFSVVALVRGGGSGIEKLDDVNILETIADLTTATIAAIGHVEEKLFIKHIVDKCASTPNGLGQYFSEMVESVSEKKTKSRAAITEQIKKQFKDQLATGQKQNKELQEKLTALTKIQDESAKKHNEQVSAANKQNKELQQQLANIQKTHKEQLESMQKDQEKALKLHNEQVSAANKQNKELQEQLTSIQKTHKEQLESMQKDQEKALKLHNEQVSAANKQNKELQEQLTSIQKTHKEQLNKLSENQSKLQDQLKQQQENFGKNLSTMQETNSVLQKNLEKITAQNNESIKALENAKSRTHELEIQLNQTKSNISYYLGWIVAFILGLLFLYSIFFN